MRLRGNSVSGLKSGTGDGKGKDKQNQKGYEHPQGAMDAPGARVERCWGLYYVATAQRSTDMRSSSPLSWY